MRICTTPKSNGCPGSLDAILARSHALECTQPVRMHGSLPVCAMVSPVTFVNFNCHQLLQTTSTHKVACMHCVPIVSLP